MSTDRVIMVRESEWREMREALERIAETKRGTDGEPYPAHSSIAAWFIANGALENMRDADRQKQGGDDG